MLTNQSFNAFLKTLEEPPEHVKFLLATTDPQKLPVTVLSRCLQFNLKRMTPEHIAGHLRHVLTQEGIPFEEPALWLLARAADGSMRDALSLTDQAIAFGNQTLSGSDVSNMLGTIDQSDIENLVNALVEDDGPALLSEINRISDFAPDYSVILADLLSLFHRVTMEQVVPGSVDNALGDAAQVESLARRLSAEDAQLFYQAALMGRKDLAVTPDARMGFEMTLLRMLAFRPGTDRREPPVVASGTSSSGQESREDPEPGPAASEKIAAAVEPEQVPQQPDPEHRAEPTPQPEPQPEAQEPVLGSQPAPAPEEPDAAWLASLDEAAESAAAEAASTEDYEPEPVAPEPEYVEAPQAEVPQVEPAEPTESTEPAEPVEELVDAGEFSWERDFRSLGIVGMPGNLASNAAMTRNGDEIVLTIDEGHARLLNARHEEKIIEALRNRFGATITLRVEQGDAEGKTPAAWEERQRQARQKAAVDSIRNDPAVQSIVERFEARVVENSIRPPNQAKSG